MASGSYPSILGSKIQLSELEFAGQAQGDTIYFDGVDWKRLPKGTDGKFLKLVSGVPTWAEDPSQLIELETFKEDDATGTSHTFTLSEEFNPDEIAELLIKCHVIANHTDLTLCMTFNGQSGSVHHWGGQRISNTMTGVLNAADTAFELLGSSIFGTSNFVTGTIKIDSDPAQTYQQNYESDFRGSSDRTKEFRVGFYNTPTQDGISSITIKAGVQAWKQNTIFTLYKIKRAAA
jgi:hypothetical protein